MPCMTMGMVEATRRKTRFPTIGATVHAKAKPPSAATAFCIYFITLTDAINNREKAKEKPHPTSRPHPSLLKWEGEPHNHLKLNKKELPPRGMARGRAFWRDERDFLKQQQLCRSCVSPAQGCGRSTLPWVSIPH